MSGYTWIKLYTEVLDDPKMGRMPNHIWKLTIQLFLLAGRAANEGVLPCVEDMLWKLHLPKSKLFEYLHTLEKVGVVHEVEPGRWVVTHFKARQTSESYDRVKRFRERYRNGICNGEVAEGPSTSTSGSDSDSDLVPGEGVQGEGPNVLELPGSPVEAMAHPDLRVFAAVTGGRIPAAAQYRQVIEALHYLRETRGLDEAGLRDYLCRYWQAWSGRRRQDGRPYDPGSLTWLTEWALNGSIPPAPGGDAGDLEQEQILRQAARGQG